MGSVPVDVDAAFAAPGCGPLGVATVAIGFPNVTLNEGSRASYWGTVYRGSTGVHRVPRGCGMCTEGGVGSGWQRLTALFP